MKSKEARELSEDELKQHLLDTQKELLNLRVQKSTGQVEKPSRLRDLRRNVARLKTFIRQRALAAKGAS
jgi:large subunit ribosomal protein L29